MELKDINSFAILLCNEFNDEKSIIDVVRKTSLKKHIGFNRATINNERAYIIYDIDRKYFFNFGTNKQLKFIWKSREDFFIIDFGENTKGEILNYLTFEETSGKETGVQVFFTSSPTKSLTLKFILISDRLASILFLRIFIPDTFPLAIPHLDDALLLIVFSSKAS